MAFADLAEQGQGCALLQRSLERGRLGHAYLLTGGHLPALEAVARTLAKTLNCENPPRRAPSGAAVDCCDECLACRKINQDTHPDIRWVRPESKLRLLTIDQVREVLDVVRMRPTEAEYKVAVMVAADRLNVQAGNAFLKTLEEPPPKSVLILLSTEPMRMMDTILSRCLRLNFGGETGRPRDASFTAWLDVVVQTVTRHEKGLLGRYRLLGVLAGELAKLKSGIEETLAASSPIERYDDLDPKLREKWEDELSAAIEAEYRRQRTDVLACLQWWLRDIWLSALNASQAHMTFPEFASATQAVARRISASEALENLRILEQTQWLLGSNVQESLAIEVGLLKLKL